MKAAWGLTVFVIVAGAVLWAVTGQAIFAVFIGLGVLTAIGAWFTTRGAATGPTTTSHPEEKP